MSLILKLGALFSIAAFTIAILENTNTVFAEPGVSVGGSATTPGADVPDAKFCSKNLGCHQIDTPDVEEETIEEEISVQAGDFDGQ